MNKANESREACTLYKWENEEETLDLLEVLKRIKKREVFNTKMCLFEDSYYDFETYPNVGLWEFYKCLAQKYKEFKCSL